MTYEAIYYDDLKKLDGINKPQHTFLLVLLPTILLLRGKMNFRNLSRYSSYCEKTYSRRFSADFDFPAFNHHAIMSIEMKIAPSCAALDASFLEKSGKHTYGKDYFFNSASHKPEKGLEISTLAVIDPDANTAFTISTRQTPPLSEIEARNERNPDKPFMFSMHSIKARNFNLHMVDTIISIFDIDPDLIKNQPNFQELLTYGVIQT